jgi:hypothetical protein
MPLIAHSKTPSIILALLPVVDATPAVGDVAANAAHNKGKKVGTTLLAIVAHGASPAMCMRNDYPRICNRNGGDWGFRQRASEIVLLPLRTRASLPLTAAEVAELVCAAASRWVSMTL